MFKVIDCELTSAGVVTSISVLDDTDGAVDKVTIDEALAYINSGVEIEGILKSGEKVSIEYAAKEGMVDYDFEKKDDVYIIVPQKPANWTDNTAERIPVKQTADKSDKSVSDKKVTYKKPEVIDKPVKSSAKNSKKTVTDTKTSEKTKKKKGILSPLYVKKLVDERLVLNIKDNETGETETFDFAKSSRLVSNILDGKELAVVACSDDYLYFVGEDIKISLPSTVVANYTLKDTMLFAVDTVIETVDSDGKKSSLFNKCVGKGNYNIQVYAPFSKELGMDGQRYEVSFTYKKQ